MTVIQMTEKKADKKEKEIAKKVIKPKAIKPKANPSVKREALAENQYLASEIAKNLGIPGFAFLVMKQEAGISDNSFLTISEFQKIYNKTVGR